MTSYFPEQDSVVTILRYRVVIEEIVVDAKRFNEYNRQKFDDDSEWPDDFFETKENKFEDWGWGHPRLAANLNGFVGEEGEGYVAFQGDVTSASDDLFPADPRSWTHNRCSPIPFACNDYFKLIAAGCK